MHRRLLFFSFLIFSPLLTQEMESFFEELYPLEIHSDISSRIVRITEGLHYERVDIDNSLSSEVLDRYLDNLDGSRYYFLSSDVSSFSKFRFEIDNLSRNGDTSPAFEIFNLYQSRVKDRIDYALSLLQNEIDFSEDESFSDKEKQALSEFKKTFINPVIIEETGTDWAFNEGCLSIPNVREDVFRKPNIKISYQDVNFDTHTEHFNGLIARVIQHEYDHIEGILFTDKVSSLKKRLLKSKLNSISKGKVNVDYKMRFPKILNKKF